MTFSIVKCSDIIDVRDGTHDSPKYIDKGYPLVTSKNIKNNKIDFENINYISREDFESINKRSAVDNGDIIMPMIGTVGNPVLVNTDIEFAIKNVALFKLSNNDSVNSKYFYYLLKSDYVVRQLERYKRGGTQSFVSLKNLRELNMPLPNLEEQERIVSILERAENAICKREESNRLLDEYLKSVFVEMFGDHVTNPKGWDKIKLKDFGKVVTGNTPSRKQEEYYGDYIEWIKSDNINTPYHYLTKAEEYLSEEGCSVGRKVPKGSILITCIAGSRSCIGNCAIANREVTFNQQINAIVPKEDVNNNFLYAQLLVGKSVVQSYSTNSMKGMISKGVFENVEFMYPPTGLQNEFGEIFDKINEMKNKCEEELLGLNNLFNSLMQKAFNGEL